MINRLGWVSAAVARGTDPDEPSALAALAKLGVEVAIVDWDDPAVDWAGFDRVILRSPWDYPDRLDEFRARLRVIEAATDLRNPVAMVEWSLDKHYLADLERAGVPITPTAFLEPGDEFVVGDDYPVGDFVVKPAVGAGSRDAASYGAEHAEQAAEHVRRLHAQATSVLVQPLLASVAAEGEWPLLYFNGLYSHAASKRVNLPRAGLVDGLFAEEVTDRHAADAEQLAVGQAAMDAVTARFGTAPSYARIDLVRDDTGRYCVLEAELVEPSLFLPEGGPEAAARAAAAFAD